MPKYDGQYSQNALSHRCYGRGGHIAIDQSVSSVRCPGFWKIFTCTPFEIKTISYSSLICTKFRCQRKLRAVRQVDARILVQDLTRPPLIAVADRPGVVVGTVAVGGGRFRSVGGGGKRGAFLVVLASSQPSAHLSIHLPDLAENEGRSICAKAHFG